MAISRNQLLVGGSIIAILAILYSRRKKQTESKLTLKSIDSSMPKGDEDIPMPEVEMTTGGVKTIPTNDTAVKMPTTSTVKPIPKEVVKPPKIDVVAQQDALCMERWNKAEKLTFFATEEDRIKRRNAFLANCRGGMQYDVPTSQPVLNTSMVVVKDSPTLVNSAEPQTLNYFTDSVGTLDTFDVH
jgi:hypothetical protein